MIILIWGHIITLALTLSMSSSSNSDLNKRFFAAIIIIVLFRYLNPKQTFYVYASLHKLHGLICSTCP